MTRGSSRPVGVLEHQGVQPVLRVEHRGDPPVVRQDTDADDGPVVGQTRLHEAVDIHRLVGAVEAADTEVDDATGHTPPVV